MVFDAFLPVAPLHNIQIDLVSVRRMEQ